MKIEIGKIYRADRSSSKFPIYVKSERVLRGYVFGDYYMWHDGLFDTRVVSQAGISKNRLSVATPEEIKEFDEHKIKFEELKNDI